MPLVQLILLACSLVTPTSEARTECEMIWAGPLVSSAECVRDQNAGVALPWLNAHQNSVRQGDTIRSVCMEPVR